MPLPDLAPSEVERLLRTMGLEPKLREVLHLMDVDLDKASIKVECDAAKQAHFLGKMVNHYYPGGRDKGCYSTRVVRNRRPDLVEEEMSSAEEEEEPWNDPQEGREEVETVIEWELQSCARCHQVVDASRAVALTRSLGDAPLDSTLRAAVPLGRWQVMPTSRAESGEQSWAPPGEAI